jgi:hypothetical protein
MTTHFLFLLLMHLIALRYYATKTEALATSSSRIAVIGGGASGIFAAIAAAQNGHNVTVFEAAAKTLTKVQISGGGRCNVMHNASRPVPDLLQQYPRGQRELQGLFQKRFRPEECRAWFEQHGVTLKTESDGRMFPVTDSSQTVMDALLQAAAQARVEIRTRCRVQTLQKPNNDRQFTVSVVDKTVSDTTVVRECYDAVILATGSISLGYRMAESLGHSLVKTVPSLFTLNADEAVRPGGVLHGLSGVSVPLGRVSYWPPNTEPVRKKVGHEQEGPLLITHYGLSGPAALRVSAFGARTLAEHSYKGTLKVHWAPSFGSSVEDILDHLWSMTTSNPRKTISTVCPLNQADPLTGTVTTAIPRRLWSALVQAAGVDEAAVWGGVSKKVVRQLALQVAECPILMTGKGTFKEEFVTAGGVPLKEIDMTRMESKVCPGLFLCGEVINVDGVTGGFNFMNAWGTGYVAGNAVGDSIERAA